ncbi:MAG: D-isomer specific 2-hydroxyacid dehydrogenase NAD-binding protein [Acidimicrobiaceae bacterium]|nr:D-isomer specific 2-hydroxyacid dehydrogenase NAD-binding protein [Acidimicrobiaceae bacterium]
MKPVVAVAETAFPDRSRLLEHFGDVAELRFVDLSTPDAVASATEGASAVIVALHPMRAEHIGAFSPDVRVIGRAGVGLDSIDLVAAEAAGVTVVNEPGYGSREVASHAVAMLLSLQRKLPQADAYVRAGWSGGLTLAPMKGVDELVVGLVGCGRIGSAAAEMLLGLVAEVLVYDPAAGALPAGVERVEDLKELLGRSDAISLHLPLGPDTEKMVDASFLGALRPGAILVNVSRGGLVDEDALVAALESGQVGGAGLDVFQKEPLPQSSPLLSAPNTLFTPHDASYSERSSWRLASWTIGDSLEYLSSGSVEHGNVVVRGTR